MRFCGGNTLVEQMSGSTYLFMCDSFFAAPLLWLSGFAIAMLQTLLLLLVWCRAEANMFYEAFSHGLINVSDVDSLSTNAFQGGYMFPSEEAWSKLGRTGAPGEGIAAAGPAGGASFAPSTDPTVGLERYEAMVSWSEHHPYLPAVLTHPDLQLDYALIFSLTMLVLWASKDALDAAICLLGGRLIPATILGLNVVLALATGYDQAYVKFLPIFVWDVPANVIGVSPISMILDSVAVMLILDLDEKAYGFIKGFARRPVARLTKRLTEEDERNYGRLHDAHEVV